MVDGYPPPLSDWLFSAGKLGQSREEEKQRLDRQESFPSVKQWFSTREVLKEKGAKHVTKHGKTIHEGKNNQKFS